MKNCIRTITLAFLTTSSFLTAHDHFAAGIEDRNANQVADAGERLRFVGAHGEGKIFHLLPRPRGQRCGGYYTLDERARTLFPNDAFSITALSNGGVEERVDFHAHAGAWIWAEITEVSGPPGANFGFWDQGHSWFFDTPSVSFPTNQETGNPAFVISEGIDSEDEDPQGHIHGRSWTADRPGDYRVGIRLVDRSTSGPGGGPWHLPSETYYLHFRAGPEFRVELRTVPGQGCVLTWPSQMGIRVNVEDEIFEAGIEFTVERSASMSAASWEAIGTVVGGVEESVSFTDAAPPAQKAFYRLVYAWGAE
jgi:hypothetical protein